jgi:hypothetical protein
MAALGPFDRETFLEKSFDDFFARNNWRLH